MNKLCPKVQIPLKLSKIRAYHLFTLPKDGVRRLDGNFFPIPVFYLMEAIRCYAPIGWNVSYEGQSGPHPDRGQGIRHEDDDFYR